MKFLVDNQLPAALARHLSAQGLTAMHVLDCGLDEADDITIWRFATDQGWAIISKDEDFFHLADQPQATVQVIWVRLGNCRKTTLLATFDALFPRILGALNAGRRVVEVR